MSMNDYAKRDKANKTHFIRVNERTRFYYSINEDIEQKICANFNKTHLPTPNRHRVQLKLEVDEVMKSVSLIHTNDLFGHISI